MELLIIIVAWLVYELIGWAIYDLLLAPVAAGLAFPFVLLIALFDRGSYRKNVSGRMGRIWAGLKARTVYTVLGVGRRRRAF